jgi:hypothetical protein
MSVCVCGHAQRNHVRGRGLCLVRSCRLCLTFIDPRDRLSVVEQQEEEADLGAFDSDGAA